MNRGSSQLNNEILWSGIRVAIIRGICMDQTMIKIPTDLSASVGDEVVILGEQQGNNRLI